MASLPKHVELRRQGQLLAIVPPVPWLKDQLYTFSHAAEPNAAHGLKTIHVRQPLIAQLGPGYQLAWAGLHDQITELLEAHGCVVTRQGYPARLPAPQAPADQRRRIHRPAMEFLQRYDRGLIRLVTGLRPESIIAQAYRAWPTQRMMVWVHGDDEAAAVARRLQQHLPGETIGLTHRDYRPQNPRLVVAGYASLGNGVVELEHRQLAFVLHPQHALLSPLLEGFYRARQARLYGFVHWNQTFPRNLTSWLEAMFGRRRITLWEPHRLQGHPRIRVASFTVAPSLVEGLAGQSDFEWRRQAIWQHAPRHEFVAALALELSSTAAHTTEQRAEERVATGAASERRHPHAVQTATTIQGRSAWSEQVAITGPGSWQPRRTVVLVENLDQAFALRAYLPWPIVSGPAETRGLSQAQLSVLDQGEPFVPVADDLAWSTQGLISTPDALPRIPGMAVLVRAEVAAADRSLVKNIFWLARKSLRWVIDVQDTTGLPARWATARREQYAELGLRTEAWLFPQVSPGLATAFHAEPL